MSKTPCKPETYSKELIEQLSRGAFITVKANKKLNTMTIGWGQIGIMWGKKVLMVPVRRSRFTHDFLEKADNFTVSVPRHADMTRELNYCGTKSGRDVDKFKMLHLQTEKGQKVESEIISACKYHFECKIIARVPLEGSHLDESIQKSMYASNDYHDLYYGEIVASYENR